MKPNNSWTTLEQEELTKTLAIIINGQKAYGKEYSVRDVYEYFKMKLQSRFNVEQIVFALNEYTDRENDIPSPADIIKILNPEKPKITQSEYIAAKDWQKRNNRYDEYTDAYDVIKGYAAQEQGERQAQLERVKKIQSIGDIAKKQIVAING